MANEMAILQEVDKCVRCDGCVISCKRTWQMKGIVPSDDLPHQKLAANQRVVVKSQRRVDVGPFVRFSCWHCENPPCARSCPFNAIKKNTATGAVWIDPNLCQPGTANSSGVLCTQQCKTDCQRGGVPQIGAGTDNPAFPTPKAWKCTLCTGMKENGDRIPNSPYLGAGKCGEVEGDLPTKSPTVGGLYYSPLYPGDAVEIPELKHQPTCVFTCPAKAMVYDTRANIIKYCQSKVTGGLGEQKSWFGDGSMFWLSEKFIVSPPKADPFMEDHVAPMLSSLLSSPFAKAALAPTLVVGGLLALAARRAKMDEELSMAGEERAL